MYGELEREKKSEHRACASIVVYAKGWSKLPSANHPCERVHTHGRTHTDANTHLHAYRRMHTPTGTQARVHKRTRTRAYTCMHTCTHRSTCKHTDTNTHTRLRIHYPMYGRLFVSWLSGFIPPVFFCSVGVLVALNCYVHKCA